MTSALWTTGVRVLCGPEPSRRIQRGAHRTRNSPPSWKSSTRAVVADRLFTSRGGHDSKSVRPFEPKLATRYRVMSEPQRTGTVLLSSQRAVQLPVDRFRAFSRQWRRLSRSAGRRFLISSVRRSPATMVSPLFGGGAKPYLQVVGLT